MNTPARLAITHACTLTLPVASLPPMFYSYMMGMGEDVNEQRFFNLYTLILCEPIKNRSFSQKYISGKERVELNITAKSWTLKQILPITVLFSLYNSTPKQLENTAFNIAIFKITLTNPNNYKTKNLHESGFANNAYTIHNTNAIYV